MSAKPTVALVGATGNLGSVILRKLLDAEFPVVIVTRQGSTSISKLPSHPNQTIKEADFSSKESLISAFTGAGVVISTVASAVIADQELLLDAAVETGTVKRVIPSDFGSDIFHPDNINYPVYKGKIEIAHYLEKLVETHAHITYTSIMNNAFFDWGLEHGVLANPQEHTATLWDGGDAPFSTTTLPTIGDAVVAVLNNLEGTANKTFKIHDTSITQNEIIAICKKIDGQEWNTTVKSTADAEAESWAELKKENPDYSKAMFGFLMPAIWGPGRDIFASQIDNKFLGLKEMNEAEIEEVIRKVLQG